MLDRYDERANRGRRQDRDPGEDREHDRWSRGREGDYDNQGWDRDPDRDRDRDERGMRDRRWGDREGFMSRGRDNDDENVRRRFRDEDRDERLRNWSAGHGAAATGWGHQGGWGGPVGTYVATGRTEHRDERTDRFESGREEPRQGRPRDFRGLGPKGYRRSDDSIRDEVSRRLTDHAEVDATEVEVAVEAGEVTLSGTVDDRHQKRVAEDCIWDVAGVREVTNHIRVQPRDPQSGERQGIIGQIFNR